MPQPRNQRYEEILSRIQGLQNQLEQAFDQLLADKRAEFRYHLNRGKVSFDAGIKELHKKYRTGIWSYLRHSNPLYIITSPIIYGVIIPLVLLDTAVFIYQQICFRVYGIPLVSRSDYIIIDRQHLSYLNAIEKINCMYCGYGNGLIAYIREVFARTEQYWCPIKHARRKHDTHSYAEHFLDYGDAEGYKQKLPDLRKALREKHEK